MDETKHRQLIGNENDNLILNAVGPIPIHPSITQEEEHNVLINGYDWTDEDDIWIVRNDLDEDGSPLIVGKCDRIDSVLDES